MCDAYSGVQNHYTDIKKPRVLYQTCPMNSVKLSVDTEPVEKDTIHALSISALTISKDSLLIFGLTLRTFVFLCQSIGLLGPLATDF